jgi:hypothetical protein
VLGELRRTVDRCVDEAGEHLRTLRGGQQAHKDLTLRHYLQQIRKIHRRHHTLEFVTSSERLEEECVNTVGGVSRQINAVLLRLKDGLKGGVKHKLII